MRLLIAAAITLPLLADTALTGSGLTNTALSSTNYSANPAPAMRSDPTTPPPEPVRHRWPLDPPPPVARPFDPPETPYGPGHRGVDLAGRAGQPVLATADGLVLYAGWMINRPVISIEHAGGLRTTYEPVTATVAVGHRVTAGQQIGLLQPGHPRCPAAACLHWGARHRLDYADPMGLLGLGAVRLLPWCEPSEQAPREEQVTGCSP